METEDARGTLLGLACGDVLGRPVEFERPGTIQRRHGTLDGRDELTELAAELAEL